MAVRFERVYRIGYFDHDRLLRDYFDSEFGVDTPAPWPALARIGADMINATTEDLGASVIRRQSHVANRLRELNAWSAFDGRVPINALLAALAAGRADLQHQFVGRYSVNTEATLRWLVFHGINEHRMWHALEPRFINALLQPSIETDIGLIPPLVALLESEKPDFSARLFRKGRFDVTSFSSWLASADARYHRLWWLDTRRAAFKNRNGAINFGNPYWSNFVQEIHRNSSKIDRIISEINSQFGHNSSRFKFQKIQFNSYCVDPTISGATESYPDRIDVHTENAMFCISAQMSGSRRYMVEHRGQEADITVYCNGRQVEATWPSDGLLEFAVSDSRGQLGYSADIIQFVARSDSKVDRSVPWLSVSAIWAEVF